jgi:AcrR family transcriptional regulator
MPRSAPESSTRAYHHGDLREALIEASETLLAERGVEGFTLREVARRAGVSPAAPAHHFGDARGLLTAVAIRAFEELTARLTAADVAAGSDRRARLRAQGEAYVRFALARPGQFGLMFAVGRLDGENAELHRQGDAAFAALERAVSGRSVDEGPGCGPSADTPPGAFVAWSLVHGFARLALDGQFHNAGPDAVEILLREVLGQALERIV